ncbi:complex I assembly factor TIMMDC1, mitochondrial [Strongylocentrotus purpuratus]|uniref:Complex I assembly factor TIMMDC1, mitochondrial n=1 Tax=Strongylocentrotus purpuratus TaxID=7668 RepID=A0A7M7THG9_STRPU|nr:complex I assembly factor TIMMDC1, mitochondrial [Strongylocentrotus purpuratus]XP_798458.3 complex I assembly factor TIMMDC1, mitochondrial [Strongylocentrotus purpuratus]|eukprot:XP_798458.3 PREDICTED: complex I assembly factor TIMMDC1, mitochondrial [Strongylocentrotus purpuratus]
MPCPSHDMVDASKSGESMAGIQQHPKSCHAASNGKGDILRVTPGGYQDLKCSVPSRQTLFGRLEHCLHKVAISRIALLPTVHASSVQSVDNTKDGVGHSSLAEGDADSSVTMVTEDADPGSGWLRLKEAYFVNNEDGLSRELYEVIMMFLLGGMLGFAYGGFPASRFARQRYIQNSQASLYSSKLEATGSSYNAASRGMIRYGYRWGWRTAVLAGSYHGISMSLAVYRNKQDMISYTVAGVSTGALYRISLGLRGMIGGAFVGGLLGIPCGALLLGFQHVMGETFIEKHRRMRAELQAERLQERSLRMSVTPQMIEMMEESIQRSEQLLREKKQVEQTSSTSVPSS